MVTFAREPSLLRTLKALSQNKGPMCGKRFPKDCSVDEILKGLTQRSLEDSFYSKRVVGSYILL